MRVRTHLLGNEWHVKPWELDNSRASGSLRGLGSCGSRLLLAGQQHADVPLHLLWQLAHRSHCQQLLHHRLPDPAPFRSALSDANIFMTAAENPRKTKVHVSIVCHCLHNKG